MSQSNGTSVWISDLDRSIRIPSDLDYEEEDKISSNFNYERKNNLSSNFDHEKEEKLSNMEIELKETGGLQLLAGKAISARLLCNKGISPSEWRHGLHQSAMTIGFGSSNVYHPGREGTDSPVARFLKGMLDVGRPYAIARYARWECIDYPSAITSTFEYGIRALINQFLASEGIARNSEVEAIIRAVMKPCEEEKIVAYRRTAILQAALHHVANETPNHPGSVKLDRFRMATMLSLARLHFSTVELRITSVDELRLLLTNYKVERAVAREDDVRVKTNGRFIKSWRLRHVRPLLSFYPYSVRYGLGRALAHRSAYLDRTAVVNELALAQCSIVKISAAWRARASSK